MFGASNHCCQPVDLEEQQRQLQQRVEQDLERSLFSTNTPPTTPPVTHQSHATSVFSAATAERNTTTNNNDRSRALISLNDDDDGIDHRQAFTAEAVAEVRRSRNAASTFLASPLGCQLFASGVVLYCNTLDVVRLSAVCSSLYQAINNHAPCSVATSSAAPYNADPISNMMFMMMNRTNNNHHTNNIIASPRPAQPVWKSLLATEWSFDVEALEKLHRKSLLRTNKFVPGNVRDTIDDDDDEHEHENNNNNNITPPRTYHNITNFDQRRAPFSPQAFPTPFSVAVGNTDVDGINNNNIIVTPATLSQPRQEEEEKPMRFSGSNNNNNEHTVRSYRHVDPTSSTSFSNFASPSPPFGTSSASSFSAQNHQNNNNIFQTSHLATTTNKVNVSISNNNTPLTMFSTPHAATPTKSTSCETSPFSNNNNNNRGAAASNDTPIRTAQNAPAASQLLHVKSPIKNQALLRCPPPIDWKGMIKCVHKCRVTNWLQHLDTMRDPAGTYKARDALNDFFLDEVMHEEVDVVVATNDNRNNHNVVAPVFSQEQQNEIAPPPSQQHSVERSNSSSPFRHQSHSLRRNNSNNNNNSTRKNNNNFQYHTSTTSKYVPYVSKFAAPRANAATCTARVLNHNIRFRSTVDDLHDLEARIAHLDAAIEAQLQSGTMRGQLHHRSTLARDLMLQACLSVDVAKLCCFSAAVLKHARRREHENQHHRFTLCRTAETLPLASLPLRDFAHDIHFSHLVEAHPMMSTTATAAEAGSLPNTSRNTSASSLLPTFSRNNRSSGLGAFFARAVSIVNRTNNNNNHLDEVMMNSRMRRRNNNTLTVSTSDNDEDEDDDGDEDVQQVPLDMTSATESLGDEEDDDDGSSMLPLYPLSAQSISVCPQAREMLFRALGNLALQLLLCIDEQQDLRPLHNDAAALATELALCLGSNTPLCHFASPTFDFDAAHDLVQVTGTVRDRAGLLYQCEFWRGPSFTLRMQQYSVCDVLKFWPEKLIRDAHRVSTTDYERLCCRAWLMFDRNQVDAAQSLIDMACSLIPVCRCNASVPLAPLVAAIAENTANRNASGNSKRKPNNDFKAVVPRNLPILLEKTSYLYPCDSVVVSAASSNNNNNNSTNQILQLNENRRIFKKEVGPEYNFYHRHQIMKTSNINDSSSSSSSYCAQCSKPHFFANSHTSSVTSQCFVYFSAAFVGFQTTEALKLYFTSLRNCRDVSRRAVICNNIGTIFYEFKDYATAAEWHAASLACAPGYYLAHKNLARCHNALEDAAEANRVLHRAVVRCRPLPAEIFAERTKYVGAVGALDRRELAIASAVSPRLSYPYRLRAALLMDSDAKDRARAELTEIIKIKLDSNDFSLRSSFSRTTNSNNNENNNNNNNVNNEKTIRDMRLALTFEPTAGSFLRWMEKHSPNTEDLILSENFMAVLDEN